MPIGEKFHLRKTTADRMTDIDRTI